MNTIIYILTALAATIGISVVVWSVIDTRNKYYDEYKERKKK